MIGACGHAEEFAIQEMVQKGIHPWDCSLYVAGFRSNGRVYLKKEPEFTCIRCAMQLFMHNVGLVWVPLFNDWASLTPKECLESAKKYALQEKTLP